VVGLKNKKLKRGVVGTCLFNQSHPILLVKQTDGKKKKTNAGRLNPVGGPFGKMEYYEKKTNRIKESLTIMEGESTPHREGNQV